MNLNIVSTVNLSRLAIEAWAWIPMNRKNHPDQNVMHKPSFKSGIIIRKQSKPAPVLTCENQKSITCNNPALLH